MKLCHHNISYNDLWILTCWKADKAQSDLLYTKNVHSSIKWLLQWHLQWWCARDCIYGPLQTLSFSTLTSLLFPQHASSACLSSSSYWKASLPHCSCFSPHPQPLVTIMRYKNETCDMYVAVFLSHTPQHQTKPILDPLFTHFLYFFSLPLHPHTQYISQPLTMNNCMITIAKWLAEQSYCPPRGFKTLIH